MLDQPPGWVVGCVVAGCVVAGWVAGRVAGCVVAGSSAFSSRSLRPLAMSSAL